MTTFQAFLEQAAQRAAESRAHGQFREKALNALGIALVFALLLADLALRALMYVRLP